MANSPDSSGTVNGVRAPDVSLQEVVAERDRLCKDLAEARSEITRLRCQAEMLRHEWYNAKSQEQEYRRYIQKLTGFDPYVSPQDVLEIERTGVTMEQIIGEIEKETGLKRDGA